MPMPKIIEIPEDQEVLCPVCKAQVIDDDGLTEQPSCPHIRFVYANGEAFEYDAEGLEQRLDAALEKADEDGAYFDPFEGSRRSATRGMSFWNRTARRWLVVQSPSRRG